MPTASSRLPSAALVSAVVLAAIACSPDRAQSEDWTFRRSYFSHAIPPELEHTLPLPVSRSAYRPTYIARRGIAVQGGYRFNTVVIRSGNSVDRTVIREDWFEIKP